MKTRLIAALSILVAVAALAQPTPPRARVLAKYLDLTPDQVAAWKQIHADSAATLKPLLTAFQDEQKQLAAALQATTPDPVAVGQLAIAVHATREKIRAARADTRTKLTAVLTPDQGVKFDAFEAAAKFQRGGRP